LKSHERVGYSIPVKPNELHCAAFLLMGIDKLTAKMGASRIPEFWFYLISLAGGVLGVIMGMFAFHHKTNKTSFQIKIAVAMVLVLPILIYLLM